MEQGSLQRNYESFEEFEAYSDTYGLAERLGFDTAREVWDANPIIQWSTNPADFKVVRARTAYDDFKDAGCKLDHHESDLYVEDTPEAQAIAERWGLKLRRFASRRDEDKGALWLDFPFMFQPFWDAKPRATA